jgi:hypothetical protein
MALAPMGWLKPGYDSSTPQILQSRYLCTGLRGLAKGQEIPASQGLLSRGAGRPTELAGYISMIYGKLVHLQKRHVATLSRSSADQLS